MDSNKKKNFFYEHSFELISIGFVGFSALVTYATYKAIYNSGYNNGYATGVVDMVNLALQE